FNQDISDWNTSNITQMYNVFRGASSFNGDISNWNTSKVTDMHNMFRGASNFDQDISDWNTSNVIQMNGMFYGALNFNQDITRWDTSSVAYINGMFYGALNFDQDIRNWNVNNISTFSNMFLNAHAMSSNFSSTPGWDDISLTNEWFMPSLSSTSIASNNSTTTQAAADDIVTLTFTASETISTPVVTFNSGDAAIADTRVSYELEEGNIWKAAYTAKASDTSGSVTFSISFTDTTGNEGTAVTSGSGSVTFDKTAPTLSSVSIASNNSTTTQAAADDIVTLTFTASETISTPVVTFNSGDAAIADTRVSYELEEGNIWKAAYTANASDTFGAVTFSIAYSDTAGNTGTAVTTTTNSTSVSFMPAPSAAFAAVKADVESKMAANARTQLNDFTTSTSSIVGSARSRFMNTSNVADSSNTTLNGDVSSDSSDLKGSTKRVTSTDDGKNTSIIEVQYQYTETKEGLKSQNASGQIINEAKLSDTLTFGRFLGATLGDGDAVGTNNIDIDFMGAQAGAYLVGNTKGGLVYDTYFAGSVIENKMGVTTSLMTADSKYYSSMLTTGASITGTLQVKKIEIRPTLSTDFSYMFRETADFDVKVGSATSVEQAAYGDIAKAQITFAPEFRLPFTFGGSFWDETLGNLWDESSVLTATPNVKCRYLKQSTATEDCGQGLSLGFQAKSTDGLLNLTAKAGMDRIGSETSSTLKLQFEKRF
ncbi:BspA family leucine-rich repeat surface protein, partial [Amylibacter sp.]|nr:BspA family leucine-rich repeat surface protein [Amylibacter sp.]